MRTDAGASLARRSVLLLCHFYPGVAGTIFDHIDAFRRFSRNNYFTLSNLGDLPDWLDLARFDALIFHYSLIASHDNYISPASRKRIRDFTGFKGAFVQDDYRWVNDTVNAFSYMRINALFPLTASNIMDLVYNPSRLPGVRKETVLAGYVPANLLNIEVKRYQDRRIDVGYRARKLPAWMGSHTLQKWQIAERFSEDAPRHALNVDISCREEDRIYGEPWIKFVSDCKATLGTESGASLCDFSGDIQRNVEAHLQKYPECDFETLRDLYFKEDDCRIMMNVISPRCFEAAALRTLMVLYEGHYSGVLTPWRHYIPLKLDHSNMDEVVRTLMSPVEAQKIIEQAYHEIACNEDYSYTSMLSLVDRIMDEEWKPSMVSNEQRYTQAEFAWLVDRAPQLESKNANYLASQSHWFEVDGEPLLVSFRTPRLVREVMLRCASAANNPQTGWRVTGRQGDAVVFTYKFAATRENSCRVLSFTEDIQATDSLEFVTIYQDPINADSVRVLNIALKTSEALPRSPIQDMNSLPQRAWNCAPESTRKVLRPFLRPMVKTMKWLFR